MTQASPAVVKIPTNSPQIGRRAALRRAPGQVRSRGAGRPATRDEGGRWRAVWREAGRREQCEAATEEKLAAKLEPVIARMAADAPNMLGPAQT